MGNRRTPARRLRLHRETVRTLSDRQLTAVDGAGGGLAAVIERRTGGGDEYTDPKSNAWTGETGLRGYCNL